MSKVDLGWLNNKAVFNGEQKITQRPASVQVTEKSEAAKRQYWSEYWRRKNHIAQGCVHW